MFTTSKVKYPLTNSSSPALMSMETVLFSIKFDKNHCSISEKNLQHSIKYFYYNKGTISDLLFPISDFSTSISVSVNPISDSIRTISVSKNPISDSKKSISDFTKSMSDFPKTMSDFPKTMSDFTKSISDFPKTMSDFIKTMSDLQNPRLEIDIKLTN